MIHLIGERGSRKVGAPLNHVPYKGVPPVVQDLLGKQIDLTFVPLGGSTADLVESGKVRVFGSSGATPSTRLPKVPAPSTLDPALATSCTPVGPPCSCRARRRRPLRYGCSALTQPAVSNALRRLVDVPHPDRRLLYSACVRGSPPATVPSRR